MLFNEKVFHGKHAEYVIFLCKDRGQINESGLNLFQSKIELYILAPVIGIIYNRKAQTDPGPKKTTIQLQQINNYQDDLEYVYRIVLLLDNRENLSYEERLDRAFKYDNDEKKTAENMKIFNEYVLGGIEYIYETFNDSLGNEEELLYNLIEFLDFEN
ncbi:hypothetical protein NMU03_00040 [Allocoprobacillus halotolerans]|uniref:Uncharacterized protein n=1 Tax=Allocoprobacillus halotolerans TaxID=2944914 RepID=A0ABY5I2T1_9FIRM|nr:hypothetical protein [Allocoprobacillus halotolerans]UTY39265.1 hypothetical protein NMU03_00040 [Allocoprobacillus halotolerans]